MRQELQLALEQARTLAPAELAVFLGELETVRVTALARLASPAVEQQKDENLDVEETARRMHVSTHYLYKNHHRFKFTRREGRKLLFSSAGLDNYLKKSR
jgi:hypothetical protein